MKKQLLTILIILTFSLSVFGCSEKRQEKPDNTDHSVGSGSISDQAHTIDAETVPPETEDTDTAAPSEPQTPAAESTEAVLPDPTTADIPSESSSADPDTFMYTFEPKNEIVYTTDSLNIRKAPSTDAEVVIVLSPAQELTRTGYHEEWSRLEYDGMTVYAASPYLTTVKPTFSNKSVSYGYDRVNRGERNIPGLMNWYTKNWGQYADFIQDTNQNVIYLTMDEGYENGYTPMILDTLKEKNVRCVFFLTKGFVDSHPQLVRRMIDEGHILGNHTCTHPANGMPSLSVEEQKTDIMTLHNMVLNQFGYEMKLFRFPAGIYSDESLYVVSSLGYRSIFWSFAYRDFDIHNQPDRAASLAQCINELHPGAIYLLHAVSETNAHILGDFIDAARAADYEFGAYPTN